MDGRRGVLHISHFSFIEIFVWVIPLFSFLMVHVFFWTFDIFHHPLCFCCGSKKSCVFLFIIWWWPFRMVRISSRCIYLRSFWLTGRFWKIKIKSKPVMRMIDSLLEGTREMDPIDFIQVLKIIKTCITWYIYFNLLSQVAYPYPSTPKKRPI